MQAKQIAPYKGDRIMALKLLILGTGAVGKNLLNILSQTNKFSVCGIANSTGYLYSKKGIEKNKLKKIANGKKISEFIDFVGKTAIDIVQNGDYDVLVELTTTNLKDGEPAFTHIKTALSRRKHVVTSNKGPLALKFHELNSLAKKNNALLKFEATVGGAIPIFTTVNNYFTENKIISFMGILNGTTNYILQRMSDEKMQYETALKEAQQFGIAERNPFYDVEGVDAAAKLVILTNAIFGRNATLSEVKRIGISRITPDIIELAASQNYAIKLICCASINGIMEVAPKLIPISDQLASVNGTLNAISFETKLAGRLTFIGKGAGGKETASAVLVDLIEISNKVA
ncbi:MAG: homoserine dehydrogenase [Candidatus Micrarchaeota archaeon]